MQYNDLKEDAVIYLAGPMRGYELFNFPAFEQATKALRAEGKQVYSPHEYDLNNGFDPSKGTLEGWDVKKAFKWDLTMVIEADAVVVLPGWENSQGALLECWTAMIVGVPVFDYHSPLFPLHDQIGTQEIIYRLCIYFMEKDVWEVDSESPADPPTEDKSILQEAEELINGDRNAQYGPPNQDFERTAKMWTAMFGREFKSHEIAMAMIALKMSRLVWSPEKRDSWVDIAGYAGCGHRCT